MRTHLTKLISMAIAALLSGCVKQVPVRASSNDRVPAEQARFSLRADAPAVESALQRLANEEGLKLAQKVAVKAGGAVWIFKADRAQLFSARAGGGFVAIESHGIGSWVAARVTPVGVTSTVWLLGKPTVDGIEVCSDADSELADVDYWCKDTLIRDDSERIGLLSGRVESEIVVRLSEAMRNGFRSDSPLKTGTTEL